MEIYTLHRPAYALHNIRTMHVYLYIVLISHGNNMFSEHFSKSERNKMDIWWRSLESVHVSGLISKCYIDLNSVSVEVLLPSEFVHQNAKNRCSL